MNLLYTPADLDEIAKLFTELSQHASTRTVRIGWPAVQKLFSCIIITSLDDRSKIEETVRLLQNDMRTSLHADWDAVKAMQAKAQLATIEPAGNA